MDGSEKLVAKKSLTTGPAYRQYKTTQAMVVIRGVARFVAWYRQFYGV